MAKGQIALADTHDLTVNAGDGEQIYDLLAFLMVIWGRGVQMNYLNSNTEFNISFKLCTYWLDF